MPAVLLAALRHRRAASIFRECPACGASVAPPPLTPGLHPPQAMEHESWCTASDDFIGPMIRTWYRRVGPARGKRLREDPAPSQLATEG